MNMTSQPALFHLTQQARGMSVASLPDLVLTQAKLCILDTIGCVLAGTRTEEASLVMRCEPNTGDNAARIWGTGKRRSLQSAIRINAYLGDVLELNDLIGGHASIGNVSAVLVLAETLGTSGAKIVEAVVRGIEVTSRVYDSVYPSLRRYTDAGIVPVGIPSTFGAAAAAAHVQDLDEEQTLNALAIAGSLAGWCPAEVIFGNGGTVKPMLFGAQPGDIGVTASYYARAGMTGPHQLLDSKVGYFATTSVNGSFQAANWLDRWALAQPRRKLHACCGYLHSPIDALGMLRDQIGVQSMMQSQIEVRVSPYVADVVSKIRSPNSANDSRFHLQYCLALAACGADVVLPEHSIDFSEHMNRADVQAAMSRINVMPDPTLGHYHHCSVTVTDAQGQTHIQQLTGSRGSPNAPLSDKQVMDKFRLLATPVLGPSRTQSAIDLVLNLEKIRDTSKFFELF